MANAYETVIGLECHVELSTDTKMFCGCRNAFGSPPNSNVCPVCLGLPGSLPVPNERAIESIVRIGLALGSEIAPGSLFHRKNYFYPDMPKDYQISQYDLPVCVGGRLEIEVDGERRTIGITRVHMEEDTGKTSHVGAGGRIGQADYALVDYNRAGVPLVECVSEPDMRSAEEARAYFTELRATLEALDVSDVRMEEGSLRCDANISTRRAGETSLGTKVEIKNLNSVRSLERALRFEEERQRNALEHGEPLVQETRHFDEETGATHTLRSKEEAFDYRYFPEPDLPPLEPDRAWVKGLEAELPELPAARRDRYVTELGLRPEQARILAGAPSTAAFFEATCRARRRCRIRRELDHAGPRRAREHGEDRNSPPRRSRRSTSRTSSRWWPTARSRRPVPSRRSRRRSRPATRPRRSSNAEGCGRWWTRRRSRCGWTRRSPRIPDPSSSSAAARRARSTPSSVR